MKDMKETALREGTMTNGSRRNEDIVLLCRLWFLIGYSFGALVFSLYYDDDSSVLWMSFLSTFMFLTVFARSMSAPSLLLLLIAGLFTWKSTPLLSIVLGFSAALSETVQLLGRFRSGWVAKTANAQKVNGLALSLALMLISLWVLWHVVVTLPSDSSFPYVVCFSVICVYATWIGEKAFRPDGMDSSANQSSVSFSLRDPRSKSSGDQTVDYYSFILPWIIHSFPFIAFFVMIPVKLPAADSDNKDGAYLILVGTVCALSCSATVYHHFLLSPIGLHLQPDASILVETRGQTYVYDPAVRVALVPEVSRPKAKEKCHVYCTNALAQIVVVEVKGGVFLYFTPNQPAEFLTALTRAIGPPDDDLEQNSYLIGQEALSGVEAKSPLIHS